MWPSSLIVNRPLHYRFTLHSLSPSFYTSISTSRTSYPGFQDLGTTKHILVHQEMAADVPFTFYRPHLTLLAGSRQELAVDFKTKRPPLLHLPCDGPKRRSGGLPKVSPGNMRNRFSQFNGTRPRKRGQAPTQISGPYKGPQNSSGRRYLKLRKMLNIRKRDFQRPNL